MRSKKSSDAGGGAPTETRPVVTALQPGEVPASSAPVISHAQALIAAAYQDAADQVACGCKGDCPDPANCAKDDVAAILSRIPADAQAAQDRLIAEAVAKERARLEDAVKWGFISAAPGEWRVSDIRSVKDTIIAEIKREQLE